MISESELFSKHFFLSTVYKLKEIGTFATCRYIIFLKTKEILLMKSGSITDELIVRINEHCRTLRINNEK